jgi:adenosine deaminase
VTESFADGLPKAELHVHLEGTLEPEDLFRFARRNELSLPWSSATKLREAYSFTGLEHFLELYFEGCQVLRQRQDFYDLTLAYLQKAAAQHVVRAEMYFGPQSFLAADVTIADQLDGIVEAIADARAEWGIDGAIIVSAHRHRSEADAVELVDLVQPWAESIAGFGLGGPERGNPPAGHQNYFSAARGRGFRTTAHAGEEGPAAYIREAIDVCHVDRIDHGNAATADAELIAQLADERIPLTMCPVSNLRLGGVKNLADHPLRALMDAGVIVTVNSDDPSYFEAYINDNFAAVQEHLDLRDSELATLARNSFAASFARQESIADGVARVNAYTDRRELSIHRSN